MKDKIMEMIVNNLLKKGIGTELSNIDMELEVPQSMLTGSEPKIIEKNVKVKIKIDNIEIKFKNA